MNYPEQCPHCGAPVTVEYIETGQHETDIPGKWDCKNRCWENDREGFIADLREWEAS